MCQHLSLLLLHALAVAAVGAGSGSVPSTAHQYSQVLGAPVVEAENPLNAFRHQPTQEQQQQQDTSESVIAEVRVLSPTDGSVVQCPVHVQYNLVVTSFEQMQIKYARTQACVEIDHELLLQNATHCYLLESLGYMLTDLSPGVHSLRVLIMDMSGEGGSEVEAVGSKQQESISSYTDMVQVSKVVHFTVVNESEFEAYRDQQLQLQRDKYQLPPPEHDDLVKWATAAAQKQDGDQADFTRAVDAFGDFNRVHLGDPAEDEEQPPFIVIGIKTNVLHGFAQRQGIRDSWASKTALHKSARVFFPGCRPIFSSQDDRANQEALGAAIETEKRVFKGDLLTHELDCDDSYYLLPDKVKEFMHFATTKFPSAAYVMIADDDAYVRSHELVDLILRGGGGWPRERLYAGHVVTTTNGLVGIQPERDPGHKNYLSVEQYPLQVLPPFTYGCHFVVSSDCARFIGKNRRRLRGLAGLDDVSVALWLLAMQVHPRNVVEFNHLDSAPCKETFVSFADLSPAAMRITHSNLVMNKPFCLDFDRSTWRKSSSRVSLYGIKFSTTVVRTRDNRDTQVLINITSETGGVGWFSQWHFPAIECFEDLFPALCLNVKQHVLPSGFECPFFSDGLRKHMLEQALSEDHRKFIVAAHLKLWTHNLQLVGVRLPTITAVHSTSAALSKSMIECLLTAMYTQNPIRVIDELSFQEQRSKMQISKDPDVFVFSILDGGPCRSAWEPQCRRAAANYVQQYGKSSSLIMISGESWSTDGLDESVLLISAVSHEPQRKRHVYIPMASMSFGERMSQSPMLLLPENPRRRLNSSASRKFCAYMYARCDQPQREYMFDLLNTMEPVDALGVCQGSAHEPRHDRLAGRLSPLYNEDAVDIYTQYKFVIAFENAQRPGYVTEKLVNAFLAGSIPIYLGHSGTVSQLFNPKSFIDCGRFATLRECALRVMEVHRSVELYESMLREPVVGNETLFHELFSWHPDVPSSFLADQFAAFVDSESSRKN